jgi:hypothetical protein
MMYIGYIDLYCFEDQTVKRDKSERLLLTCAWKLTFCTNINDRHLTDAFIY